MKKINSISILLLFLLLTVGVNAQSKTGADFFAGKWKVLVTGTPYGDLKRIYVLDKKDNILTGIVQDSTGKEITKCSKVDVKDNEVTLYYQAMGNDVSITLIKKDDDHVTGSVLGQFDAKGERIKQ
ncbi:MAG TPA: hypothetical protein VGQ04_07105 [Chitinophagaceae bacterium]|nr:hypothetical protein [Chitinophagaceae bacterium]